MGCCEPIERGWACWPDLFPSLTLVWKLPWQPTNPSSTLAWCVVPRAALPSKPTLLMWVTAIHRPPRVVIKDVLLCLMWKTRALFCPLWQTVLLCCLLRTCHFAFFSIASQAPSLFFLRDCSTISVNNCRSDDWATRQVRVWFSSLALFIQQGAVGDFGKRRVDRVSVCKQSWIAQVSVSEVKCWMGKESFKSYNIKKNSKKMSF